jgi:hypothetical protein
LEFHKIQKFFTICILYFDSHGPFGVELPTAVTSSHQFQPIAVETFGPINSSAITFLSDLGRRLSLVSGEDLEGTFCFSICRWPFRDLMLLPLGATLRHRQT